MSAEFPFTGAASTTSATSLPMFREYAWDFNKDTFLRDSNGNMILLEGNPALEVWIYNVMKTERWAYLAYSDSYGVEIFSLLGKTLSSGERRSELCRTIKEALMVNPYVRRVDRIDFEENEHGRLVNITVAVTTVYGALTI